MTVRLELVCNHTITADREPRRDTRGWFADRPCPDGCKGKQRVVAFWVEPTKKEKTA